MPRFFLPTEGGFSEKIVINGRDAEHIRVLRLRVGERLTVCDGRGRDYICSLLYSGKDSAELEVLEIKQNSAEPSIYASVLCGLPKGDKTDYIIQKSVESGASEVIFFYSGRCIQKPDTAAKKLERWQRISEEAAKQSGRGIIPEVKWLPAYAEAVEYAAKTELPLLMYETGEREKFSEALRNSKTAKTAAIITGPEGGFEAEEVVAAKEKGIHICSMGERILRCETAPVAALTALMYDSGNLE